MPSLNLENTKYYSNKFGLPIEVLENMYLNEQKFHNEILAEENFEKRTALYEHIYTQSAKATAPYLKDYFFDLIDAKKLIYNIFKKEIKGKSLLDVGCGSGAFLYVLAKEDSTQRKLTGLDVKTPNFPVDEISKKIDCLQSSVVDFEVDTKYETAMLDNVYEHIAPADKPFFLKSLSNSLQIGGKLILIIPNKLFGPADWTLLENMSFSGQKKASCLHLDETTFKETMENLKAYGFGNFKSPLPFVALNPLKQMFPNFRISSKVFAFLENSILIQLLKKIMFRGKCLLRMEVIIIAEKLN